VHSQLADGCLVDVAGNLRGLDLKRQASRETNFRGATNFLIIAVVFAVWSNLAFAADISFVGIGKIGDCTIRLTGRIEKGDTTRLKTALAEHSKNEQDNFSVSPVICLNSPGGDYEEGLRIIDLISTHQESIRTHVPAGASCDSTCALVFLSGRFLGEEDSVFPWRTISARAKRLAFHHPEVDRNKLTGRSRFSGEEVVNAYEAGVSAVARLLERMDETGKALIVEALKRKASEPYEIDTLDEIGRWHIGLTDFISPNRVDAKTAQQACANEESWRYGNSSDTVNRSRIQ
jgi:hypothetical protein